MLNTLIVSLPGVGKTTLLRDCIRLISNGSGMRRGRKVCVLDERSELAACHMGVPQNDLGIRTDVLDCCPKQQGMSLAVRSLSPEVIAVDELGGREDASAVEEVLLSGCRVIGTAHGDRPGQLVQKQGMAEIYSGGLFQRYIFLRLGADGERGFEVYNQRLERLC